MQSFELHRKRRAQALRLIADRGMTVHRLTNGKAHITGPGVDLKISDLAHLIPSDLDDTTHQYYHTSFRTKDTS